MAAGRERRTCQSRSVGGTESVRGESGQRPGLEVRGSKETEIMGESKRDTRGCEMEVEGRRGAVVGQEAR